MKKVLEVGIKRLALVLVWFCVAYTVVSLMKDDTPTHEFNTVTPSAGSTQYEAPVTTSAPVTTKGACKTTEVYPEDWYTDSVPQETPGDPMPDPACNAEYEKWLARQGADAVQVTHCISDRQDGYMWTEGDKNYKHYEYQGRSWACIGTTPQKWMSRPGVTEEPEMGCFIHPMVRGELCVPK